MFYRRTTPTATGVLRLRLRVYYAYAMGVLRLRLRAYYAYGYGCTTPTLWAFYAYGYGRTTPTATGVLRLLLRAYYAYGYGCTTPTLWAYYAYGYGQVCIKREVDFKVLMIKVSVSVLCKYTCSTCIIVLIYICINICLYSRCHLYV